MTVGLTVANGTLTLPTESGVTVVDGAEGTAALTLQGTVAAINTALDGLVYATTVSTDDELDITADDEASVASGDNQATGSVAITALGPTRAVPDGQTIAVDQPLVFSSANDNAITVGDSGPSDTQLTVALSVTNGTLTLGTISGISIPVGSNASASMTLVGTAAEINTALDGLSYQTSVYNDDMLLVTVDDAGTIASGSNQAADSVDLAVSQPSVNVPGAQSTALNTARLVFAERPT